MSDMTASIGLDERAQNIPSSTRAWHLDSYITGQPTAESFSLRQVQLPEVQEGQILVANEYLSVDPYMRGRMSSKKSYIEPYEVGAPMDGPAVGRVLVSRAPGLKPGDHVFHSSGWREHSVVDAATANPVDAGVAPLQMYLGMLGIPGLTAYIGLKRFAEIKEGDTVFVSGAAGAVGSAVGQMASLMGAGRVIGSAGSDEKVTALTDTFGFDAAFNYRTGAVADLLAQAAPDGIDVFFDNVGGEHLEAAIGALRTHARIVISGMVSQYNDEPVVGPRNLWNLAVTRSDVRAFMVTEEMDLAPQFFSEAASWLSSGALRSHETVVEGFENTLEAFFALMRGANVGKMVVKV